MVGDAWKVPIVAIDKEFFMYSEIFKRGIDVEAIADTVFSLD